MKKSTHTQHLAPSINLQLTMMLWFWQGQNFPIILHWEEIRNKYSCSKFKAKKDNQESHVKDHIGQKTNLSEFSETSCVQEVASLGSSSSYWSTIGSDGDCTCNVSWKEWMDKLHITLQSDWSSHIFLEVEKN